MRPLAFLLLVACGEPAVPSKPEVDCGAPIPGLDDVLAKNRVILVGESHGSAEIPRVVGDMVCRASARGPVVLAIEHEPQFQNAYDAAIEKGDRVGLLAAGEFGAKHQDGRASIAMADLVMRLHALRVAGRTVSIGLFQDPSKQERDPKMAQRFSTMLAAHPNATTIAITGNIHAKKTVGVPWDPAFTTMGSELVKHTPLFAIHAHGMGKLWNCIDDECAPHATESTWNEPPRSLVATELSGYDAALNLGRLTASAPAVSSK